MALATRIALAISGQYESALDVGTVQYPFAYGPTYVLTDGSGANQANKIFTDTRTLAASASETLDLAGSLADAFGATLTFTKVRGLVIAADAANTNDVVVGGASSNGFVTPFGAATDKVKVKPGGLLVLVAPDVNGYAVTASTGDLLQVANSSSGTGVNYTVFVIGS